MDLPTVNEGNTFFEEHIAPHAPAPEPVEKPKQNAPFYNPASLKPGDWIECTIVGQSRGIRYVVKNFSAQGYAWLGDPKTDGCVSSVSHKMLRASRLVYLGNTRRRWWWKIVPWRNNICPFYQLPKA